MRLNLALAMTCSPFREAELPMKFFFAVNYYMYVVVNVHFLRGMNPKGIKTTKI